MPLAANIMERALQTHSGALIEPLFRKLRHAFDFAVPAKSRSAEAGPVLRKIQADLSGMSGSTEGVFLLVGSRLADLQARARQIAAQTTSIAEVLSHDTDSLAVLDEVLTAAGGSGRSDGVAVAIGEIRESAKSIHQAIQGFGPLVETFDVLGVMTRIESVRFEAAGAAFAGLADAVTALSQQIRQQIGATADSAAVLLETTSRAAEQMRQAEQKHRENLGPLATQTSAELRKIGDHRSRVSKATRLLAERFEEVSAPSAMW